MSAYTQPMTQYRTVTNARTPRVRPTWHRLPTNSVASGRLEGFQWG
jgi:hypothetical protein